MLSSNDIAQMFAAQSSQFGQANFYANTIGIANPAMGLGAYGGSPYGGFQAVPGLPGVAPPPPVFNYGFNGITGPGYGAGNRFAAWGMGAASLGVTGMGVAAGLAGSFSPIAPMIDPVAGFLRAGPRIPLLNPAGTGTLMSGLAGAVPGMAIAGGAALAAGTFFHGGHQQSQIATQLGQFGFMNPLSRTGMGFTRQDASDISGAIRQLAHVPDMLTSVEELTRLLPRMRQMGVMQGVRDAAEFNRRFKETVTTIRDMSRILGTTMEDASVFFEQSRSMGFTSRQSQLQNALNVQFTSGLTGMSMGQVGQMQMSGAAVARSFGARGVAGAVGVTNLAQRIQAGLESGSLESGLLEDVTGGVGGSAGVGVAAEKMYGMMAGLSQTSAGRVIMAGAMKRDASGRVVLDQEIITRLNRGEVSVGELKARASRLSQDDKISFQLRARSLGGEFAGSVDIGRFMQGLVGNRGRDAAGLVIQRYTGGSASAQDIDMLMGLGGDVGVDRESHALINAREQSIRDRIDPAQIWKRAKTRMFVGSGLAGLESAGAKLYTSIGKAYDDFIDDLVGRHVVTLSKEGAKAFERALAGGNNADIRHIFEAAHGLRPGDAGTGGMAGTGRAMFAGGAALAAGLGIGLATGGIGLAAYGGAALVYGGVRSMLHQDSALMNYLRSSDTETGRTVRGQREFAEGLLGSSGNVYDSLAAAADKGRFVTAEGRAAAEAMRELKVGLSTDTAFGTASAGKRFELVRSGMAESIAASLSGVRGVTLSQDAIREALLSGDVGMIDRALKSQGGLAGVAGGLEGGGGQLLRAAMSARARGVPIDDFLTGGIAATEQANDALRISLSGAGGSRELIRRYGAVGQADALRKQVEGELTDSGLSGTSISTIRGNSRVRRLLIERSKGMMESRTIDDIISSLADRPDKAAAELNRLFGLNLSATDIAAAQGVIGEGAKVGHHAERYQMMSGVQDVVALSGRMSDVAGRVRSAAEAFSGTEEGKMAMKFADALSEYASGEFDEAGIAAVRRGLSAMVNHYIALKPGSQKAEKFLQALGPAGGAVRNAVTKAKGFGGTITRERLKREGLSDEAIQDIMGDAQTRTVTATVRQKLMGEFAGSGLARTVAGAGATEVGGVESQMLEALKKISQNADNQTTLLAVLAADKWSADAQTKATQLLNGLRANGT